ncbi:MAG: phosphatase PAP2 family protein [Bacteroidales bacterium]|nr:phosphatase PAP2 family protein [Bacteroidales bacterium]
MRIGLGIKVTLIVLLGLQFVQGTAQTDSVLCSEKETRFDAKQIIMPVSIGLVGATGLIPNSPLSKLSVATHEKILLHSYHTEVDDWIQYLPVTMYMGLNLTSLNTNRSFAEKLLTPLIAYASMVVMTEGLKYTVSEKRPDSNKCNSFPSGHTATAFTGAELVRLEYGNIYGSVAYVVATTVGAMRVYNDRHWIHDVVAGAGIGILSARIGNWLCPELNKKSNKVSAITPTISIGENNCLMGFSLVF